MKFSGHCERCNTLFTRKFSRVDKHSPRYCSRTCKDSARSENAPKANINCDFCKRTFSIKSSHANKGRRFCGPSCSAQGKSHGATLEERFWSRVHKTDTCWIWTGGKLPSGYGHIKANGKSLKTHRVSFELHFGSIPDDMFVCHHCDNPSCVNPKHLFLGDAQANMSDMVSKGRSLKGDQSPARRRPETRARGNKHGNAKLSEADVLSIRKMRRTGLSQQKIADHFKVSQRSISAILNGLVWRHVE